MHKQMLLEKPSTWFKQKAEWCIANGCKIRIAIGEDASDEELQIVKRRARSVNASTHLSFTKILFTCVDDVNLE